MDIQCLLEQEIYTDRSGISEFRIVEDGTGKRFLARGFLHEVKTGARLILKGVSGPDGGGCISYGSAHTVTSTEEEAVAVLCCADGISEKTARAITDELGGGRVRLPGPPGFYQRPDADPGDRAIKGRLRHPFLKEPGEQQRGLRLADGEGFSLPERHAGHQGAWFRGKDICTVRPIRPHVQKTGVFRGMRRHRKGKRHGRMGVQEGPGSDLDRTGIGCRKREHPDAHGGFLKTLLQAFRVGRRHRHPGRGAVGHGL